jgi:hypothetical protein
MPKKNTASLAKGELTEVAPPRRPLIFLSHDSRDAALAEAFETLLNDASGGVLKAFRSSDRTGSSGIEFGAEWYATIMTKLAEATDVVALVTSNSLGRPWILYEVGVARGRIGTPAFGIAFGVALSELNGPFAQFQNSGDDEDSLTKLVLQLIRRNPDATPREEAVRRQVRAFRDNLAQVVAAAPIPPRETSGSDITPVIKLFEEVKVMFRELPDTIIRGMRAQSSRVSPISAPTWESTGGGLGNYFLAMVGVVESSLRSLVGEILREHYPDLKVALKDRIISSYMLKKNVEHLTFGEIRDILRALRRAEHVSSERLPALEDLERLQAVIDVRNRFAHGGGVQLADAANALAELARFIERNDLGGNRPPDT